MSAAEAVVCATLLTCVLNTSTSAVETTPAKAANDRLMCSPERAGPGARRKGSHSRTCRSRTTGKISGSIYLIAVKLVGTPFGLPPQRHRQRVLEGFVMRSNYALRAELS